MSATISDVYVAATALGFNKSQNAAAIAAAIAGGGLGTDLGFFNVEAYGAVSGSESTSNIQAAVDACAAAGGGTVWFPNLDYVVGGALQDASRGNCQIMFPAVDPLNDKPMLIKFKGPQHPVNMPCVVTVGGGTVPLQKSVIRCTRTSVSNSTPACIGGWGTAGFVSDFTMVYAVFEDFSVEMPADTAMTAVDLSHTVACDINSLYCNAGSAYIPTISVQTTATSFGLKTPKENNGAIVNIRQYGCVGFYNGLLANEHTRADALDIMACKFAIVHNFGSHSHYIQRALVQHCKNAITFTNGNVYFRYAALDIEHASSGTWTPTYDVDDTNNYGHGDIQWSTTLAGTGQVNTFTVNGAANVISQRLGVPLAAPLMHGFRAHISTNFTITNGGVDKVHFDVKDLDPSSEFDNVGNYRFQPTVAGYYLVSGTIALNVPTGSLTDGQVAIYKNGASYCAGSYGASFGNGVWSTVTDVIHMDGNIDYIELFAYASGSLGATPQCQGNADRTNFSAHLIKT